MVRRICLAAVLAAALLLPGCSARAVAVSPVDTKAAADHVLERVEFRDSLMEAEGDVAKAYYRLDDAVESYTIYISGSGATAEEIAVLQAEDESGTDTLVQLVQARIQSQKDAVEGYNPAELVKLNNPVLEVRGTAVWLILADDASGAKEAIDSFYKER